VEKTKVKPASANNHGEGGLERTKRRKPNEMTIYGTVRLNRKKREALAHQVLVVEENKR